MKKLLIMVSVLGLTACGAAKHYTDPVAAQEAIECATDKFTGNTTCQMPEISTCSNGKPQSGIICQSPATYIALKVVHDKNKNIVLYGLNGFVSTVGWAYPQRVVDNAGRDIKISATDSKVSSCTQGGCTTREYVSLPIDRAYIANHAETGMSMKVYGKRSDALINIPAAYVQGFDNYLRSIGI